MIKNNKKIAFWLMKSEPNCYSIDDLKKDKKTMWDGVRNYQVRNMIRDDMRVGDNVLFYHSNSGDKTGVVGLMKIVKSAYPDPTQFDSKSEHPDPTSDKNNPRWFCVDVKYVSKFKRPISLAEIKTDPKLQDMAVAKKGSRLSITPVSKSHFDRLLKIAN